MKIELAPTHRTCWQIAILVAIAALLFASTYNNTRKTSTKQNSINTRTYLDATLTAKIAYLLSTIPSQKGQTATDSQMLHRAISSHEKMMADSTTHGTILRLAILQRILKQGDVNETLCKMHSTIPAADRTKWTYPKSPDEEIIVWSKILNLDKAVPVPEAQKVIQKAGLGWYAYPLLAKIYLSHGDNAGYARENWRAISGTLMVFAFFFIGGLLALIGVGIAGVSARHFYISYKHPDIPLPSYLQSSTLHTVSSPVSDALYNAFLLFLLGFLLVRLAGPALLPSLGLADGKDTIVQNLLVNIVFTLISASLPAFYLHAIAKNIDFKISDIGLHIRDFGKNITWGFLGYLAALPIIWLVAFFSSILFRHFDTPDNPAIIMFASSHGIARLLLFIEAAVMAPLLEETIFRGIFLRSLMPRMRPVLAIVVCSAVFAILHPQLPIGFAAIFVLGALFSILSLHRNSLVPGIVAHAVNNGAIMLMLFLMVGD